MVETWAVARFTAFAPLTDSELLRLKTLAGPERQLRRGEFLRHEGDAAPGLYLLRSGWTASSMIVAGGARQIIRVHMPGDMLGLPSLALARAADTLFALSPASVSVVSRRALGQIFEACPRLAALLFLISQEERVTLMDRLASMGRTTTLDRLAALILQLHARILRSDPDAGDTFRAPLTQNDLADLLGVTGIYINRTIQQLRRDGIVSWVGRSVTIHDAAALRALSGLPERDLSDDLSWLPA